MVLPDSVWPECTMAHLLVLAYGDAHSFQLFLQFCDVRYAIPTVVQLLEEFFKKAVGFVFLANHCGQQKAPYLVQHGHRALSLL